MKNLLLIICSVFALNINAQYTKLHDFDSINGSQPMGSLMQATDGMLYGMTSNGGTSNNGVIFKYNPTTSTYTKNLDFATTGTSGSIAGSFSQGTLMQASDGMLYGMSYAGGGVSGGGCGSGGCGVLFQYNPTTNVYTKKFDFADTNGANPYGSLMQATDGMLYGMTNQGGTGGTCIDGCGVLFQYNPATSIHTKKLDFAGTTNGSYPKGSLMQASDGMLYGLMPGGGTSSICWGGCGVLFQYNPATNTYTKKLDFDSINGRGPAGSLMQASDGMLYGMTSGGGASTNCSNIGCGVLFQYNPATNVYTKELDFTGATNGQYPIGNLMQASDGMLYGMSVDGGVSGGSCGSGGCGVLFQYNPATNVYTKKFDFAGTGATIDGSNPNGSLIQASDGMLYGMTSVGGANGKGVLFKFGISSTTAIQTHNQAGVNIFSYGNAIKTNGTIPQGTQLKVINTLGQVVLTTALQNNIETNLPSGIYTIQVIDTMGSIIEIKKCALINN
ncbi:MAG TPA: choice-of-anchor tandem repeat GloVer-containing protein [Bacteroidia bacterium]